jgi:radical SAM protein with 4Fe4S-binding SPASM domain
MNINRVPLPQDIILELTHRCNLQCGMCYLSEEFLNKDSANEVSGSQINDFLDSLLPHRPTIVLTGGEPFLRSDIFTIIENIKQRGMRCCIFSNGTLLDTVSLKKLIELELDSISFSFDGPKEVFERITSIPGSFDKLQMNIESLLALRSAKSKPKVTLSCVLSKKNIDSLNFVFDFFFSHKISLLSLLHLHFVSKKDSLANFTLFQKHNIHSRQAVNRHTWGADYELAKSIIKIHHQLQDNQNVEFIPNLTDDEIRAWYGNPDEYPVRQSCFYPWVTSRIAPDGTVYVCQNHVVAMGNITNESFPDIWNGVPFQRFRAFLKTHKMFPGCNRCCKLKTYTRDIFPEDKLPVIFDDNPSEKPYIYQG